MGLLTREERQLLTRSQRRALRAERRKTRKDARQSGDGVSLNMEWLERQALELIRDQFGVDCPGPKKMDEVLDELVEDADNLLVWSWAGPIGGLVLEIADGPAIRALVRLLIRPHVQRLYEELAEIGVDADA